MGGGGGIQNNMKFRGKLPCIYVVLQNNVVQPNFVKAVVKIFNNRRFENSAYDFWGVKFDLRDLFGFC